MTLRDALQTQFIGGLVAGTTAGLGILASSLSENFIGVVFGVIGAFVVTYCTARAARRFLTQQS